MTDRARKRQDAWRKTNKLNGTFNTHEALKALKSSGFDEKQAESVVETINKAVNETVATKADLAILTKTVEDIQENIKENMATKDELKVLTKTVEGIQENIKENLATKADLKAQGIEIANLETRIMRMMWLQLMVMISMFVTVVVTLP